MAKTKKPTPAQQKKWEAAFIQEAVAQLDHLPDDKVKRDETKEFEPEYVAMTKAGMLRITVYGARIMTRFSEPDKAKPLVDSVYPIASLNPYSGKWNWHFEYSRDEHAATPEECVAKFIAALKEVAGVCPDCDGEQEGARSTFGAAVPCPTCQNDAKDVQVQEKEVRQTSFGQAIYIRIATPNYRQLSWTEVWTAFERMYPGKYAVQIFPPRDRLVDEENVYHLFVLDTPPAGTEVGYRN